MSSPERWCAIRGARPLLGWSTAPGVSWQLYRASHKLAMNLMAVMLGRNTYAAALVVTKLERPVTSIGGASVRLRYDEDALRRVLGADQWILRLRVKPDGPGEFAVIGPLSQHELILVFDVRVDELKQHPALDAIVGFVGS